MRLRAPGIALLAGAVGTLAAAICAGLVLPARAIWISLACLAAAVVQAAILKRQVALLAYSRPAEATITSVERKKSDHGTYWRVHYEWTLLSGARRRGRYNSPKKTPPAVGDRMTVVYDRDTPLRHIRYPAALASLRSADLGRSGDQGTRARSRTTS